MTTDKVTRVEVIDHTKNGTGRAYVKRDEDISVTVALQDSDRTLKIFINQK